MDGWIRAFVFFFLDCFFQSRPSIKMTRTIRRREPNPAAMPMTVELPLDVCSDGVPVDGSKQKEKVQKNGIMQCMLCLIRSESKYTRKWNLTKYRFDLTTIFRIAHWFPGFLNWALPGPNRVILGRNPTSLNSVPLSFMSLNFLFFFWYGIFLAF